MNWEKTDLFKLEGSLVGYEQSKLLFNKYLKFYDAYILESGNFYNGYKFTRIYELPKKKKCFIITIYFVKNSSGSSDSESNSKPSLS